MGQPLSYSMSPADGSNAFASLMTIEDVPIQFHVIFTLYFVRGGGGLRIVLLVDVPGVYGVLGLSLRTDGGIS